MTREEAIDILKRNYPSSCFEELCKAVDIAIKALSVQPEPLTDMEQRIFLASIGREEKVCKKADEEYYGIDDINLVRVCREIERKVKKALWY
ncbi:MAG: hypothetical protein J6T10_00350 [Methanobrevibacter sp.]|nr:hypothetical protein [Methanobrevibacter sp.]